LALHVIRLFRRHPSFNRRPDESGLTDRKHLRIARQVLEIVV
jgi:hypothetical protein